MSERMETNPGNPPRISVVIVSDYTPEGVSEWRDQERALAAFRDQDIAEPFEIVLVENEARRRTMPPGLARIAPRTRVLFADHARSATLKDLGVAQTSGKLVAVIEADCEPARDWLRVLVRTLEAHPGVDAVSGRTTYGQGNAMKRVWALLDRAYVDVGAEGPTQHVCNNGALYRRDVLQAHPYPDDASPFVSSVLRLREMLKAGRRLYFQPAAAMTHDYEGFRLLADVRAHSGLRTARLRFLEGKRITPRWQRTLAILLSNLKGDLRNARRVGRVYLKARDWPLFAAMVLVARALEVRGVLQGLDGEADIPESAYR
jgi:hypothetical protein